MFCRRARCESGETFLRKPKKGGARQYVEFRVWLQKEMGIDATAWAGIDEADDLFRSTGVLVSMMIAGQRAALFVVTDAVAEELATLSHRQPEEDLKIRSVVYLQFVVGNSIFRLSEGCRPHVERKQGATKGL